jgi:hypothetical protein
MHPESELPFQHCQRLPASYGLELFCVPLKNNSRIDASGQGHQAKHGLVVEKRCFINVDVGSAHQLPVLRAKTRLVQEPGNRIRLGKRPRHVRPTCFLRFGSQCDPALLAVGRHLLATTAD